MNNAQMILSEAVRQAVSALYSAEAGHITIQKTKPEFEGDFTVVTFSLSKYLKKSPEILGNEIGNFLVKGNSIVAKFNVVKGFLNIGLSENFWMDYFNAIKNNSDIGLKKPGSSGKTVMVEYSSPNTNKPLHLGHVRNNLLGFSVAEILKANGHTVIKANLINDRGIHICKSMLAWKLYANGETPETAKMKGDHLVGKYYVKFSTEYEKEIAELVKSGKTKEEAENDSALMRACRQMLLDWELGNPDVVSLWTTMNNWVYDGFKETYKELGVDFDKIYYESQTYLLGKQVIEDGLKKNVFYKKENGSVAVDLRPEGLDEKILLRGDGTSVYITQDLGTAIERFKEFENLSQLIYTVGNEQDYHFNVLFKTLEKLGYNWAKECYHLSYGMVELPDGKLKSREGKVVDADELMKEMTDTAETTTRELGKVEGFSEADLKSLFKTIGMGALKYFILKVDPKKKMLFNPKESIDFNGHTGPFIQYTYARIKSVLRKTEIHYGEPHHPIRMNPAEKEMVKWIYDFESTVEEAGAAYNPSLIANFIYELAKLFNRFYHDHPILKEENPALKSFRLQLCFTCAHAISNGMKLLGITVPEKM